MKLKQNKAGLIRRQGAACSGFTLIEGMIGVGIMGILFVSLYTGMTTGFGVVRMARENLRATQVLQEKFETIRLYTWEQINTPGFVPQTFTAPFYTTGDTNNSGGFVYQGRLQIRNAGISEAYRDDLRLVTVELNWNTGNISRTRRMSSFAARYGLQNYIY